MKQKIITTALLSLIAYPSMGYDVKTVGQGGAGVASGDFTYFLINPAHLSLFNEEEKAQAAAAAELALPDADAALTQPALSADVAAPVQEEVVEDETPSGFGFGFAVNVGAVLQDENDLVDNLDPAIDSINDIVNSGAFWDLDMQDAALRDLSRVNNSYVAAKANASTYIAVPNSVIPLSVFVNTNANAAGLVDVTDVLDRIEQLKSNTDLNLDDSTSYVEASGIWTLDVGLTTAHEFVLTDDSVLRAGASFKYQQVTLYDYRISGADIVDYDQDDIKDCDESASGANIDLGLSYAYQDWLSFGLVAENLIGKDYESARGNTYSMEPQVSFGLGLKYGIISFLADIEMLENQGMSVVRETQFANVGFKFDFWKQAAISFGYQMDMKGNDENLFCVGLGISPGDVVSLDLVGMIGADNTYGGGFRLGIKF